MLAFALVACAFAPLLHPAPPRPVAGAVVARHAAALCADSPPASFDELLSGLLASAHQQGSAEAALDEQWLERLDETFIPMLASKIEVATEGELPQLNDLMAALQKRTQAGFESGRDQLQQLLEAGEINKMDARLAAMVKKNEVDAGIFYVIMRNLQDAQEAGDETTERLLTHIYTRLQEELEKKTEPALALLHKLTRTDNAGIRENILRHNLLPQTSTKLPDGSTLPLNPPAPALVEPMALAGAIESAIEKMIALPIERAAIEATAEEIRNVAKEARVVVADAYPADKLDEFTDALTPAFTRALPPKRNFAPAGEPTLVQQDVQREDEDS